jgi:hypothetical protein
MVEAGDGLLQLRTDDLTWREVGEELVVLKLSTGTYLTLNTVGRELWLQLEGGATGDQLAKGLIERYGITPEQAAEDVAAFVADLRGRELLAD